MHFVTKWLSNEMHFMNNKPQRFKEGLKIISFIDLDKYINPTTCEHGYHKSCKHLEMYTPNHTHALGVPHFNTLPHTHTQFTTLWAYCGICVYTVSPFHHKDLETLTYNTHNLPILLMCIVVLWCVTKILASTTQQCMGHNGSLIIGYGVLNSPPLVPQGGN